MPSKGEKNYVYADVSHFLGKPGVLFKIYSNILVPEVVVEGGGVTTGCFMLWKLDLGT